MFITIKEFFSLSLVKRQRKAREQEQRIRYTTERNHKKA